MLVFSPDSIWRSFNLLKARLKLTRRLRIYEINARNYSSRFDLIRREDLHRLASLGFDALWLLGAWRISDGAKKISKIISPEYDGSPFAIGRYEFSPELGGQSAYLRFLDSAHSAGLSVLLDFIPNHLALDSPWIDEDPRFFIRSNPEVRKQDPGDFFLHKSGELIAFGRDPYFPPWRDTAQLDYSYPVLRSRMIQTLKWIARHADGVRCDMAMLILRDYVRQQWYPNATQAWFADRFPGEFWEESVRQVRSERPDFIFLAECYWDKERVLQSLGFDFTYEKKVYDALVQRNPGWLHELLAAMTPEFIGRSLFFLENHDEVRAASVFSAAENLAALALILSLPGSVLIHHGQLEGLRKKLPVQMPRPFDDDRPDSLLRRSYEHILKTTTGDVFQNGAFELIDTGHPELVSFVRHTRYRSIAYIGMVGGDDQHFGSMRLNVTALARRAGITGKFEAVDILNSRGVVVQPEDERYLLDVGTLLDSSDSRFLLIEACPAR
jgi:glycosidase